MVRNSYLLGQPITLTPEERQQWIDLLETHYKEMPSCKNNYKEKAEKALNRCLAGWKNSPKDLETRIKMVAKVGAVKRGKAKFYGQAMQQDAISDEENLDRLEEVMKHDLPKGGSLQALRENHIGKDKIIKSLQPKDRKFFQQRLKFYLTEFEFNDSSDFSMLLEVIADEIKINKIHEMEFAELENKKPDVDRIALYSKIASEAFSRLEKALKSLGLTKDQRKDEQTDKNANIATLSVSLDKKLKGLQARRELEKQEEIEGLQRKFLRGDVFPVDGIDRALHNRVPEMSEIDKIIKEVDEGEIT